MKKIFLSIGTNLGDKFGNLNRALRMLSEEVSDIKKSSIYETEPVGYKDQPRFYNMVIEGNTALSPEELLAFVMDIESEMGRKRTIKNGPRIIDIDVLYYDDRKIKTRDLMIPHPRMLERAFVMIPLFEIAPDLTVSGKNIKDILKNMKGEEILKL